MKKLRLDVNALCVNRFEVSAEVMDNGTVFANEVLATFRTYCGCTGDTVYPQFSCNTGSPCKPCVD